MKRSQLFLLFAALAGLVVLGMTRPSYSIRQQITAQAINYRGDAYVCFTNTYGLDCVDREDDESEANEDPEIEGELEDAEMGEEGEESAGKTEDERDEEESSNESEILSENFELEQPEEGFSEVDCELDAEEAEEASCDPFEEEALS